MTARRTLLCVIVMLAAATSPVAAIEDAVFVLDQYSQNATVFDATSGEILWNLPTSLWTSVASTDAAHTSVYYDLLGIGAYGNRFAGFARFDVASAVQDQRVSYVSRYESGTRALVASADGRYLFRARLFLEWIDLAGNSDWVGTSIRTFASSEPPFLAVTADPSLLVVASSPTYQESVIQLVNPFSDSIRGEIHLPGVIESIAVNAAATTAWISQYSYDNELSMLAAVDLERGSVAASTSLPRAFVALNAAENRLYLASGASLSVLDPQTLTVETSIDLPATATGLAISADGERAFITHAAANLVSTVDTTSGRLVAQFSALSRPKSIVSLAVRPSVPYPPLPASPEVGECIIAVSSDITATDPQSGRIVRHLNPAVKADEMMYSLTADGRWLDSAQYDYGTFWRHDAVSGSLVKRISFCPESASRMVLTDSLAMVRCPDGPAMILDRATLQLRANVSLPEGAELLWADNSSDWALAARQHAVERTCSPSPLSCVPTVSYFPELLEISLASGEVRRSVTFNAAGQPIRIAMAPDRSWFAVIAETPRLNRLRFWALRAGDWAELWNTTLERVGGAIVSADSQRLIISGAPGLVLDAISGAALASTSFFSQSLTYASDGRHLYANTDDGIAVVDSVTGEVVDMLEGAQSPNGRVLVGDLPGGCHDPDALTPRPTRSITPTLPPTFSPRPTNTGTPTRLPTQTPTSTPPTALLRAGAEEVLDGTADVFVRLEGNDHVAGVQVDLSVAPPVQIVRCRVNSEIHKPGSTFAKLPIGCTGSDCKVRAVLVSVDNVDPIASPAIIFRCQVLVPAAASAGDYALHLESAVASDGQGQRLPVEVHDGALHVEQAAAVCSGDCNRDGAVEIDELISIVNIAREEIAPSTCAAADYDADGLVTVNEIIRAMNNAVLGCAN